MRSRFQQRLHDDSGVVAIIVALSISTFLLGFAALAVDAGAAYATKAELQSVADRLALAAASGLPDTAAASDAFQQSFTQACPDPARGDRGMELWGNTGPCAAGADFGWADNRDRADGELEFFAAASTDAPLNFGLLPSTPRTAPANPTAVRVTLPPVTVPFGFGGFFGVDSADVRKSATARIGTSLGAGILPFAATQADVSNGQFCVVDPAVPPATPTGSDYSTFLPSASTSPKLRIDRPNPATIAYDEEAEAGATDPVTLTLVLRDFFLSTQKLKVYIKTLAAPIADPPENVRQVPVGDGLSAVQFTVEIPKQRPGVSLQIWVTGEQKIFTRWRKFASDSVQLTYGGRPIADPDPCTLPQASGRGFIDLTRKSPVDTLETNIRRGPQVQLYSQTLLDPVLNIVGDLCVQKIFQPKTSCVTTNGTPGFNTALSKGLFSAKDGVDARLKGDCGNGTTSSGGEGGIDASKLVGAGASRDLVDPTFGDGAALRRDIVGHVIPADKSGWVSGQALRCPRMAVLPVVSDRPPVLGVVLSGGKEITGFVYLWIDGNDAERGLTWNGNRLRSLSGYVIDPKFLPALVGGSAVIGPYLGTSMPKEATLICDLSDQSAGRCADAD